LTTIFVSGYIFMGLAKIEWGLAKIIFLVVLGMHKRFSSKVEGFFFVYISTNNLLSNKE
jgi:hypothetical protein